MDADLLNPHQVLPGGDLLGEAELELLQIPGQPALVRAVPRVRGAQFVHLEPVARAVVVTDIARCLRQVDLFGRTVS
jgi:hypothetical protein